MKTLFVVALLLASRTLAAQPATCAQLEQNIERHLKQLALDTFADSGNSAPRAQMNASRVSNGWLAIRATQHQMAELKCKPYTQLLSADAYDTNANQCAERMKPNWSAGERAEFCDQSKWKRDR